MNTIARSFIFFTPLFLAGVAACGDSDNCIETATCDSSPSGSTSSSGGATTTTTAASGGGATTGSGAGGTGGASQGGGGQGGGPDTTPPTVVNVSPGVGEVGVTTDTKLVITFSEAMDQAATEDAFASGDFGVDTMVWLDASTLEITPTGLSYSSGGPSVAALVFEYQIKGTAADLAGNALGAPFDGDFDTLREVTDAPARTVNETVSNSGGSAGCENVGGRYVGWSGNNFCRHLVSFELSTVPNGAELQAATLSCTRYGVVGDPFAQFSTDFALEHVDYPANNLALGFGEVPESKIGTAFSGPSDDDFALSVTAAVEDDLMQNKSESQFRIKLDAEPVNGPLSVNHSLELEDFGPVVGGCPDGSLSITYLAP